ncbi:replicative DNA helicase [Candidatus Nomurabacteria bacterium RIFCSPLOWO2_01_FULL_42_20]|uniref:Replicative DNA helicase n=1 Tax=Candidatus Nomurabacteria bacterium RIFCSPHIGHO2_01_FULL_42_16 TaxID=1801743 RepID=A0A1F6VKZ2_9BACT|nr:MAG: replicative DNA helicase [Candidatus Nomurabacteria bacterium RIFCSPHIGHO2_01_FULL_42_16]OGI92058.1 MAG: replicative DNA helicase [Candidatus Nomurabacteria bacterium RIFCSPLOWO2_01_FULL_42_20]
MSKSPLRIPPQNLDAEKAVLGSIMLRPEALYEIVDLVTPESFYADKHRIIFENMLELASKNEPIDLLSLGSRLGEKKALDSIGGNSYLALLTQFVPASTNIKHYAQIVQKKNILRKLIEAADHIGELGFSENEEAIEEILDKAEKKIFNITLSPGSRKFTLLKDTLKEAWERLEKLHENKGELRGIPTGFKDLDIVLSGFQKSDLIVLAARPSVGKTTLALDIVRNAATRSSVPTLIFSLEMSSQQLVDRLLAAEAKVNAWNLRTGKLSTDEEFSRLRDSLDKLSKAPIYIDDRPSNTIVQMKSTARKLKAEHSLGLIVVDYLQLMTTSKNYDSMVNQVTEISRSLKSLARELEVPVIALSQLSRAIESRGGKPRLSDLRDSGSIEQDADVVMFIHREDRYKEESERTNIAEILIEKHRNGPTGKIELYFDAKRSTFLPLEKSNIDELIASGQPKNEDRF